MKVFIDANTYIKLFEASPSITFLSKLVDLLKDKKFTLIFPIITRQEVYRNISSLLKKGGKQKVNEVKTIPDEFEQSVKDSLREIDGRYQSIWKKEQDRLSNDLKTKREMAKTLFGDFMASTIDYPLTDDLVKNAERRKVLRFSPGKENDPLGDQLAWEILLKNCIDDNLVIVSSDSDFCYTASPSEINPLLKIEWSQKSVLNKSIEIDKDLGTFIKRFDKDFDIPKKEIQKEKEQLRSYKYPSLLVSPSLSARGTATINISPLSGVTGPTGPLGYGTNYILDTPEVVICMECGAAVTLVPFGMNVCPYCGFSLEH